MLFRMPKEIDRFAGIRLYCEWALNEVDFYYSDPSKSLVFCCVFKLTQRPCVSHNGLALLLHLNPVWMLCCNNSRKSIICAYFPYGLSTVAEQIKTWFSQLCSILWFSIVFNFLLYMWLLKLVEEPEPVYSSSAQNYCAQFFSKSKTGFGFTGSIIIIIVT